MIRLEWQAIGPGEGHEAGRSLLARMYREYRGQEMPEIVLEERGKPRFAEDPLCFSVTHTPRHVFCAISEKPIGIDAEEMDREINPKLAEKILSPSEMIRYEAAADKRAALLRLWVLKEAAAKLSGEGLRGYPKHTDFSPQDPRILELDGCYVAVLQMQNAECKMAVFPPEMY